MKHLLLIPLALIACSTPLILQPATGPNTSYPCGVGGVVCSNRMCCGENYICGGDDRRCPANECCFEGEAMRGDGGILSVPQRPEQ